MAGSQKVLLHDNAPTFLPIFQGAIETTGFFKVISGLGKSLQKKSFRNLLFELNFFKVKKLYPVTLFFFALCN